MMRSRALAIQQRSRRCPSSAVIPAIEDYRLVNGKAYPNRIARNSS